MDLKKLATPMPWFFIAVILLVFVFVTSGLTWIAPSNITTAADTEALFSHDGIYNPIGEFRFGFVAPTGISLYFDNDPNTVSDWVMIGELDGMMIPFILPVKEGDVEPDYAEDVTCILAYPTSENIELIDVINDEIYDFLSTEFGYTQEDYDAEFMSTVFEESSGRQTLNFALVLLGVVMLGVGFIMVGVQAKKKAERELDVTAGTGEGFTVEANGNNPIATDKHDDPWD